MKRALLALTAVVCVILATLVPIGGSWLLTEGPPFLSAYSERGKLARKGEMAVISAVAILDTSLIITAFLSAVAACVPSKEGKE